MRKQHPNLKWVEKISYFLDSKFRIPGTTIRFGLDPIASIFPVIGDFSTYAISLTLILTMYKNGASNNLIARMILNSTIDAVVGSIPVIGTIFDVWFKSNNRNLQLLKEHYEEGKHQGSAKKVVISIALVVLVLVVVFGIITYYSITALWNLLTT